MIFSTFMPTQAKSRSRWLQLECEIYMMLKRRIYYPYGMISLLVLPILLVVKLISEKTFVQLRAMEISYPDKTQEVGIAQFKKMHPFSNFELTDNDSRNNLELVKVDSLLRFLKQTKDDRNGVRISLIGNVKYDYFIKVFDLLLIHEYLSYAIDDNQFWIVWCDGSSIREEPKRENKRQFICGTQMATDRQMAREFHEEKLKEIEQKEILYCKQMWPIGMGYIILVIISFIDFRNKYLYTSCSQHRIKKMPAEGIN